jgi:hypothetical protein
MVEEPDESKDSRPVLKPSNKGDFVAQVTTLPILPQAKILLSKAGGSSN